MSILKYAILGVISASLLVGCSSRDNLPSSFPDPTAESQREKPPTAEVIQLDKTRSATLRSQSTPMVQVISVTSSPTQLIEMTSTSSYESDSTSCNMASAGVPLDVTVPDDTRLEPQEDFSKVWRLVNSGSCTWTAEYSIVWFSGDDLNTPRTQPIIANVSPGETVDVAVDMVAPKQPGLYSSYWMLKSDSGELFGIGPNGDSAFWVRIQVVAVNTLIPTITSTPVPTTTVLVSGYADIFINQSIDLDSGDQEFSEKADGMLEDEESNQLQWTPLNSGRFAVYGMSKPGELECRLATLSSDPIQISDLDNDIYLCYRTGDGLPGIMQIRNLPVGESPMHIDFTTWAVP